MDALALGDEAGPSAEGWHGLGRALAMLHALPHSGFGLLENRADRLVGRAPTPAAGLCSRLENVWPFCGPGLTSHPLVQAAPELERLLRARRAELGAALGEPSALGHTELHAGQLRWRGGRLVALLDFGDASIPPPAGDLASPAFFHGWEVAADAGGLPCGREAAPFGLLALHHVSRSVTLGRPAWMRAAVTFARGCLDRL